MPKTYHLAEAERVIEKQQDTISELRKQYEALDYVTEDTIRERNEAQQTISRMQDVLTKVHDWARDNITCNLCAGNDPKCPAPDVAAIVEGDVDTT